MTDYSKIGAALGPACERVTAALQTSQRVPEAGGLRIQLALYTLDDATAEAMARARDGVRLAANAALAVLVPPT
jgi:hypothetical protein